MTMLLSVVGIIILAVIIIYNNFVTLKKRAENALALIDTMLAKRHDLIPNLVATVKGYAEHERETLEEVTRLRAAGIAAKGNPSDKLNIESQLGTALQNLLVRVEAYPELKADKNFMHLQRTLTEIEEQISAARRTYNDSVTRFNTSLETFPGNMLASLFRFTPMALFSASAEQKVNPTVDLSEGTEK